MPALTVAAVLAALTAIAHVVALRLRMPHSILLVFLGVVLAFLPGVPPVAVGPEIVLLVMLPPLLYEAGVGISWRGFRSNLGDITMLAIGCTLFTAGVVAAVAHWLLGMPWAVAFVLGAVVSPPDPVAPMAIARRLNLPTSLLTILESEGLVNDAIALILLSFAIGAVATGTFSLAAASTGFAAILIGETIWGVALAAALLRARAALREPQAEVILALLTPYAAFWPPHMLGGSGVLAAVVAGLYVSWNGRRLISPATRLQGYFVWGLIVHLIEGLLFLLIGLQAHAIIDGVEGGGWTRLALAGIVVSLVVVAIRFVWVIPVAYLTRLRSRGESRKGIAMTWQSTILIGFTGIRGVVSLAGALSIPVMVAGGPFPERPLILFVTFCVILVTLVGQGSSLPWLIRRLGLDRAGAQAAIDSKTREVATRADGVRAALEELERAAKGGAAPGVVIALRRRHNDRLIELLDTADSRVAGNPVADDSVIQARLIDAERAALNASYQAGDVSDEARRRIERELDLEDARNRHAHESATGDILADPGGTDERP